MRRITEIMHLPISQLSDEEIVKAAMYRLGARAAGLVYEDTEGQGVLLFRYKNRSGSKFCQKMKTAWEDRVSKLRHITNKNH